MRITRIILLNAADLDLFETPLRQDRVRGGQITSKRLVSEPQSGRQRMHASDMRTAALTDIVHDFNHPIIIHVSDRPITITRDFMIEFGNRRRDRVGVEVPCRRPVLKSHNIAVAKILERLIRIVFGLVPSGEHGPMVVVIFVVITCHLLLRRTDRVRLNVRVEQATTPAHVLERHFGTIRNL